MTLQEFSAQQYQEIVDDFEQTNETLELTLEELTQYIEEWTTDNGLTPEQTIAEFEWRELTWELGLETKAPWNF